MYNQIDVGACRFLSTPYTRNDYTWFMLRFPVRPDFIPFCRNNLDKVKHEMRRALNISITRIAQFHVSYTETDVLARIQLVDNANLESYFTVQSKKRVYRESVTIITDTLSRCLRLCLHNPICVAVTFAEYGTCFIVEDAKQADLAANDPTYVLRVETEYDSLKNTYVRKKLSTVSYTYDETKSLLDQLEKKVHEGKLEFYAENDVMTLQHFVADRFVLHSGEGEHGISRCNQEDQHGRTNCPFKLVIYFFWFFFIPQNSVMFNNLIDFKRITTICW